MRVFKHWRPIVWAFPESYSTRMPGHDHSLRKLCPFEGLSNPSMVYNWICPVRLKDDCPYEVMARVFSEYFAEVNQINTKEEYLNFGWAAALFTESDWTMTRHNAKKMHL